MKIHDGLDLAAQQLLRFDVAWHPQAGGSLELTYGFATNAATGMPSDLSGFTPFNASQMQAAEWALQSIADVADISFRRVNDPGSLYSNNATLLFRGFTTGESDGRADLPATSDFDPSSRDGDVWINSTRPRDFDPVGALNVTSLTHEIGHALGLSHPEDYPSDATYDANAQFFEDSQQYTIMSTYNAGNTGGSLGGGFIVGPQILDIMALQARYGANMTTRTGDTIYGFNSNSDRVWLTQNPGEPTRIFSIWDAGGNDTLDFSGFGMPQLLDLRAGEFSSTGGLGKNVSIAPGVVIENAIGGSGSDAIGGNEAANSLSGGAGNDSFQGGAGNDTIDGGSGVDAAFYEGRSGEYSVAAQPDGTWLVSDSVAGRDDGDALRSVEILKFADGSMGLGSGGGDVLQANVSLTSINGGAGADTISGGANSDVLRGGDGDDSIAGGVGFDDINGNMGNDTISGGNGNDWVVGGKDNDLQFGGDGNDIVWGNLGNDTLDGGAGNDQVRGGQGDDSVSGGAGDDFVSGDRGNDTVAGGLGADLFHGSQDAGVDRVVDFSQAEGDRVMLDPGTTFTLRQIGADTVIDMGGGNQMILVGVDLSTLKDGWIFEG